MACSATACSVAAACWAAAARCCSISALDCSHSSGRISCLSMRSRTFLASFAWLSPSILFLIICRRSCNILTSCSANCTPNFTPRLAACLAALPDFPALGVVISGLESTCPSLYSMSASSTSRLRRSLNVSLLPASGSKAADTSCLRATRSSCTLAVLGTRLICSPSGDSCGAISAVRSVGTTVSLVSSL